MDFASKSFAVVKTVFKVYYGDCFTNRISPEEFVMIHQEDWEHHFDPSRREQRRERKNARRTDRSKYKITDQAKILRDEHQKIDLKNLVLGKVIRIRSQEVVVEAENRSYSCALKGSLKLVRDRKKNLIIVGDNVYFEVITPDTGSIHYIMPRSSVLSRQENLHRRQQQLVAANIDQVLITTCLAEPSFKPAIVDRYRIAARKGNMEPIVLINKRDLADQYPKEEELVQESLRLYASLGIKAVCFSTLTGEGLDIVRELLTDKVSVLSGQSGTGKTCLINALTGLSLRTGLIRAIGKGSHTTTSTQLLRLPFGGWCVDTPGIRSFGVFSLEKDDLKAEFTELFAQPCAFTNCWHGGEEGCAVHSAIDRGKVSPIRFLSYLSLISSIEEDQRK